MVKKPTDRDTIRKIWLAGIGAYGRAYSEAKGAVDSLTGKGSDVFDELVQKGEILESVGKFKANELVGKGKAAVGDIKPDFDIDDRIARMRARLSGTIEKSEDRLAARVDRLEAKLDAILEQLNIGDAAPAPSKKKPMAKKKPKPASKKKMTTQRTPKAAATKKKPAPKKASTKKKPAAKKTTSKKTTAKKTRTKKS